MFKIQMFGREICVTLNNKKVFIADSQATASKVARFFTENEITSAKAFAEHKDSLQFVEVYGSPKF